MEVFGGTVDKLYGQSNQSSTMYVHAGLGGVGQAFCVLLGSVERISSWSIGPMGSMIFS